MTKLHFEEHIQATQEDIYRLLIDLEHYEDWLEKSAFFVGIDTFSELPLQVGTTYREKGFNSTINGEITEMKPYRRFGLHQHRNITRRFLGGSLDVRIRYTLKPEEDKTLVARDLLLTAHGIFRVLQWPLQSALRQENERVVREIKRHFEAPPAENAEEEKVLVEARDDEATDEYLENSEEETTDDDVEAVSELAEHQISHDSVEGDEEPVKNQVVDHSKDAVPEKEASDAVSTDTGSSETH